MPKVDGLEALARIRQDERTKTIPVIVFGSSEDHPDIRNAMELGANSVIIKPLDFSAFMKSMGKINHGWLTFNTITV